MTSMTKQYFDIQKSLEFKYGEKSVVVWMCGSFYEVYGLYTGVDKVRSAKGKVLTNQCTEQIGNLEHICMILGINMTKRSKDRDLSIENPYMCGFPSYALPKHLAKLLQYQYTVSVYDQYDSDDPCKEKERRPTKIYSPSTYISDDLDSNNVLMSCAIESFMCPMTKRTRLYASVAHIDLSTGYTACYEYIDDDDHPNHVNQELHKLIYCVNPSELLLINLSAAQDNELLDNIATEYSEKMIHRVDKQTNPLISQYYDAIYQETFIKKIYSHQLSPKGIACNGYRQAIGFENLSDVCACFIQLLQFTYEHDPHIIEKIAIPYINKSEHVLYLNQDALCNLNLLSTQSPYNTHAILFGKTVDKNQSCYDIINKTKTKMGSRLLKMRLTRPITDSLELEKRYNMVDTVKPYHREYSSDLGQLIDIDKKYRQVVLGRIKPHEFANLFVSLCNSLVIFEKNKNLFEIPTESFSDMKKMVKSINHPFNIPIMMDSDGSQETQSFYNRSVYPQIDKLFDRVNEIQEIFKLFDNNINYFGNSNSIRAAMHITTDRHGHCILTTTKRAWESLQKVIATKGDWTYSINYSGAPKPLIFKLSDLTPDTTSSQQQIKLQCPLLNKLAGILEKSRQRFQSETTDIFNNIMKQFTDKYNSTVVFISKQIAMIDVAVSSAISSIENYYVRPKLIKSEKASFNILGLRHPIIERITDHTEYITNNVQLDSKNLGILLYGLNSSGKSSILRAIGLNIILAQAGFFCSCDSIEITPYVNLFTKISSNDNLFKGQSTFVAEMHCLKDMLQQSNSKTLILCDELTAGTETNSATGIVAAAISLFIKQETNFVFTTHLHGLMEFPEIRKNARLNVFHFKVSANKGEGGSIIQDRKLLSGSGESQYGIEIADAVGLPQQFIASAYEFRMKHQGQSSEILSNKRSKYNSKVIVDSCTECGFKPSVSYKDDGTTPMPNQYLHVHHQEHQATANDDGRINGKNFHKNVRHNLVVLCEKCHQEHHKHA